MATFTIDSENNITAHSGLPLAGADESRTFTNQKELAKLTADWPVSRLVDTWNSFAGVAPFNDLKPVKKFTDRKAAVARIWKVVQRLLADVAEAANAVAPSIVPSPPTPTFTGAFATGDFNGDGALDAYVAENYGPDQAPDSGEPNNLLLSATGGLLRNVSSALPTDVAYNGDNPIACTINGFTTPAENVVTVQH